MVSGSPISAYPVLPARTAETRSKRQDRSGISPGRGRLRSSTVTCCSRTRTLRTAMNERSGPNTNGPSYHAVTWLRQTDRPEPQVADSTIPLGVPTRAFAAVRSENCPPAPQFAHHDAKKETRAGLRTSHSVANGPHHGGFLCFRLCDFVAGFAAMPTCAHALAASTLAASETETPTITRLHPPSHLPVSRRPVVGRT
jgi:hypothetical protein